MVRRVEFVEGEGEIDVEFDNNGEWDDESWEGESSRVDSDTPKNQSYFLRKKY